LSCTGHDLGMLCTASYVGCRTCPAPDTTWACSARLRTWGAGLVLHRTRLGHAVPGFVRGVQDLSCTGHDLGMLCPASYVGCRTYPAPDTTWASGARLRTWGAGLVLHRTRLGQAVPGFVRGVQDLSCTGRDLGKRCPASYVGCRTCPAPDTTWASPCASSIHPSPPACADCGWATASTASKAARAPCASASASPASEAAFETRADRLARRRRRHTIGRCSSTKMASRASSIPGAGTIA